MRSILLRFAATTYVMLCFSQSLNAQYSQMTINPSDAKRMGMEIMWRTQLDTTSYSKLQNITQVFGKTKKLVKFVVSYQDVVEEFYENDVDRFGRKIGVAGAQARAEAKLSRYKSIGIDSAKLEKIVEDPDVLAKKHDELMTQYQSAQGFEKGKLENKRGTVAARR